MVGADETGLGFTLKFKLRARSLTYFLHAKDARHLVMTLQTAAAQHGWPRTAENDAPPMVQDDWRVDDRAIGENRIEAHDDFIAWAISNQSQEVEFLGFSPGLMMLMIDTISDAMTSLAQKGSGAVH